MLLKLKVDFSDLTGLCILDNINSKKKGLKIPSKFVSFYPSTLIVGH